MFVNYLATHLIFLVQRFVKKKNIIVFTHFLFSSSDENLSHLFFARLLELGQAFEFNVEIISDIDTVEQIFFWKILLISIRTILSYVMFLFVLVIGSASRRRAYWSLYSSGWYGGFCRVWFHPRQDAAL